MQNNALVRIFAILFVLVSIYQLSFTFISSNQEKKAKIFAKESISDEVLNYLELRIWYSGFSENWKKYFLTAPQNLNTELTFLSFA